MMEFSWSPETKYILPGKAGGEGFSEIPTWETSGLSLVDRHAKWCEADGKAGRPGPVWVKACSGTTEPHRSREPEPRKGATTWAVTHAH